MMGAFPQMMGQQPQQSQQEAGALGNRQIPPQRAIDKLLMQQQQQKASIAFPQGVPPNQQPPQMMQQNTSPNASSFMQAVLGAQPGVSR
jgi:hypothetical protein